MKPLELQRGDFEIPSFAIQGFLSSAILQLRESTYPFGILKILRNLAYRSQVALMSI